MVKNETEKVFLVKNTIKCLDTQQIVATTEEEAKEIAEENIREKILTANEMWGYTELEQVVFKTGKSKKLKLVSYLIQDAREG